jgi:hypothetical protein
MVCIIFYIKKENQSKQVFFVDLDFKNKNYKYYKKNTP